MEVLPFGFLVFISGALLVVQLWGIIDAKFAVTSASREAMRAYVEADSEAEALAAAGLRGHETMAAYGRDGERVTVGDAVLAEPFGRCARVSATVSYDVPVIVIPWIGDFGSVDLIESTYTELVDPFRDDLPGVATC